MNQDHMQLTYNKHLSKFKVEIFILNLVLLLFLFRTVIPIFKYPFVLAYPGIVVYSLISYRKELFSCVIEYLSIFKLVIFLITIWIVAFLFSNKIYLVIFKDIINGLILLTLFFLYKLIIRRTPELKFFILNLIYLIISFAIVISVLRLLELFEIYSIDLFSVVYEVSHVPQNVAQIDQNFALLPTFFGITGVFFILRIKKSIHATLLLDASLILFFVNIILAGSRRGIILLIIIVLVLIGLRIISIFYNREKFLKILDKSWHLVLTFGLTSLLLIMFFAFANYRIKNSTFDLLGSNNMVKSKYKISLNLYRYIKALNKTADFTVFNNKIWDVHFHPEDPDSGWGTRFHTTVFPVTGEKSEIVPSHARGYKMDSSCDGNYYSGNDMCEAYTLAASVEAQNGKKYYASVYCFVSDSAEIDVVCLTVLHNLIFNGKVIGNTAANYNLDKRNVWQKLEVEFKSNFDGNVPVYMTFWKQGVKNFKNLNGYVIFAYPENKNLDTIGNISSFKLQKNSSHIQTKYNLTSAGLIYLKGPRKSNSFNTHIKNSLTGSDSLAKDPDPIRHLVSDFISEDTAYFPLKNKNFIDKVSNLFLETRLLRWKFALQIYKNEYTILNKLFGGGYKFLNWYGFYFYNDKTRSDYPHNPLLSVLLYSGLAGLCLYLFLLYRVLQLYLRYLKEYSILFIFFGITFFYSFFSAVSPFDPPTMGFFMILPFFIDSFYKKENF